MLTNIVVILMAFYMKSLSSLLEKYTSYFSSEDCYLQIPLIFVVRKIQLHLKLVIQKNGSGSGNFNHKNDESAGIIPLLKTPNKANNIGS